MLTNRRLPLERMLQAATVVCVTLALAIGGATVARAHPGGSHGNPSSFMSCNFRGDSYVTHVGSFLATTSQTSSGTCADYLELWSIQSNLDTGIFDNYYNNWQLGSGINWSAKRENWWGTTCMSVTSWGQYHKINFGGTGPTSHNLDTWAQHLC